MEKRVLFFVSLDGKRHTREHMSEITAEEAAKEITKGRPVEIYPCTKGAAPLIGFVFENGVYQGHGLGEKGTEETIKHWNRLKGKKDVDWVDELTAALKPV